MPRVTIVLPTYNSAEFLPTALDSIVAQTYTDWECIVVDDGSTDETPALMADLLQHQPRLWYHRLPTNQGNAVARNVGLDLARGSLLAPMDADDIWAPQKLEVQVAALDAHPEAVWSHASAVDVDPTGRRLGLLLAEPPIDVLQRLLCNDYGVYQPTVVARRDALVAVGGWDPRLRLHGDTDLWMRLAARYGDRGVVAVPDILLTRLRHPCSVSANVHRMWRAFWLVRLRWIWRERLLWRNPRLAWEILDRQADSQYRQLVQAGARRRARLYGVLSALTAPWRADRWRRVVA